MMKPLKSRRNGHNFQNSNGILKSVKWYIFFILIDIPYKFIQNNLTDNETALKMVWHRTGDKQCTDSGMIYWQTKTPLSLDELKTNVWAFASNYIETG